MSIPGALDCPGAELVYRAPALVASPDTLVVVNCAGRTRSIIGAQSLIDAGLENRVVALENGTMGWHLAGLGSTAAAPTMRRVRPRTRWAGRNARPRGSPTGTACAASTATGSRPCPATPSGRSTCSTCARRPSTKRGICPAHAARPAASSSRPPTHSSGRATRNWF